MNDNVSAVSGIQMGHSWAQSRRTISFARGQTEGLRHIYLGLTSDMDKIPGSYGAITSASHDATTNPLSPPENVHFNSSNLTRALDEVLSELRALEVKYMLEQNSSEMSIPLLLRLQFKIKGKRDLNRILRELHRHNDSLEKLTEHLRRTIPCNLALSAHQMASMNVESHAAVSHITPLVPQADQTLPTPFTEDLISLSPTVSLSSRDIPATSDPLQTPLPLTLHLTSSSASSRVCMSVVGVFQSSTSFVSYEREDNYSLHSGDRICPQCHQMCRRV